jgi:hypothetical protein
MSDSSAKPEGLSAAAGSLSQSCGLDGQQSQCRRSSAPCPSIFRVKATGNGCAPTAACLGASRYLLCFSVWMAIEGHRGCMSRTFSCATTGRWRGAMHRRLTCLTTVARARHQRLAICSSAPKARRDCMSLARGGRRHVSMAARFGGGASGAADAKACALAFACRPPRLLIVRRISVYCAYCERISKSTSEVRLLSWPDGSTHPACRPPTISRQIDVRVSSPPSCCLAPSKLGREGIRFATITTTTVRGIAEISIDARRPQLRSWSAPSSGPCRRVLSRSLGQQPHADPTRRYLHHASLRIISTMVSFGFRCYTSASMRPWQLLMLHSR